MAADHGGNPDIGGNSAYDVSSLSIVGPLFISGSVTSESKPPTSDDVDVGAPDFWSDDLLFNDDYCDKLDDYAFYDTVKILDKTGTLANDSVITTSCDEDEAGRKKLSSGQSDSRDPMRPPHEHPINQDYDLSNSEDEPKPADHTAHGKCRQCGVYRWIVCDWTHCNGVYKPLDQADVSKYSAKEDPEYPGIGWSIGDLLNFVGSE